jgi:hypothetical protein
MSVRIPGEPAEGTPYDDGLDRSNLDTADSTEGDSNFTTAAFDSRTVVGWESNYTVCERSGFRLAEGEGQQTWDGLLTRPYSYDHKHPAEFARHIMEREHRGSVNPETPMDSLTYIVAADVTPATARATEAGAVRCTEAGDTRVTEA